MSRMIQVSTDVYAKIWASREAGEETENAILGRLLGCPPSKASNGESVQSDTGGVHDARNDVHFPEGFEITRTYRRKDYRAVASQGAWLRSDTGERFPTLNQLNESIAAGPENVWNGTWKYRDPSSGKLVSIDALRR